MPWVVVFDTNVQISALLSARGNPALCVALARATEVESITCEELLTEFQRTLITKLGYSPARARIVTRDIRQMSRVVPITNSLTVVDTDPDDNKVLECAVVGGATHIVTGDKRHLLPIGEYQGIAIVSPADFLALVAAAR